MIMQGVDTVKVNQKYRVKGYNDKDNNLYLTNRFISTPSRTRAATNPKTNRQTFPSTPLPALPNTTIHLVFPLNSSLFCFSKSFQWYIIQLFIVHTQLFSFGPEILTIPDNSKIKRVRRFPSSRKSIYSLPFCEPIEPKEVHQETETTPTTWFMSVLMSVCRWSWRCVSDKSRIFRVQSNNRPNASTTVSVSVAHLPSVARPTTTAHVTISPKVGHFKCSHLSCDLPKLRCEKNDCPCELKGSPGRNRDKEGIIGCEVAEIGRKNTGKRYLGFIFYRDTGEDWNGEWD